MAFKNDPIVIGLRAREGTPPGPPRDVDPAPVNPPVDNGASAEECRVAYAEFRELAARTERRWRWIAAITGVAGIGVGAAVGVWQGSRRTAALPEST
jgi:hypothetical protein